MLNQDKYLGYKVAYNKKQKCLFPSFKAFFIFGIGISKI